MCTKKVLAVAVTVAAALVAAASAQADTANVNPYFGCNGGARSVAAGSTIVIRIGWSTSNRGLSQAFVNADTTVLSVNGSSVDNTEAYRAGPAEQADGSWITWFAYPTGITLQSGQSLTFSYDDVVSHPVTDGEGFVGPGSIFGGPLTCTVTAA
jgi:hypothetical protein